MIISMSQSRKLRHKMAKYLPPGPRESREKGGEREPEAWPASRTVLSDPGLPLSRVPRGAESSLTL